MNKINKKSLSYKRKKRERKNMFKKNNQVNKSILKYTKDNKRWMKIKSSNNNKE